MEEQLLKKEEEGTLAAPTPPFIPMPTLPDIPF